MTDNHGRLNALLEQESSVLEDIYAILKKELVALKARNSESITLLAEEKNILLNDLEKIDNERQLFLQSDNKDNFKTVSDEINRLNSEIEVSLDKCKKQNNINGGIIEMSKLFNENMLDIICGQTAKENTYNATGKNKTDKNQHSLGRV